MRSAIFIRSYWKDLEWLECCVRAIDRHCQGFAEILVVVPRASQPWLARNPLPGHIQVRFCPDYRDDYLGQQLTKLLADTYVDAEFIVHVDADCIFNRPTHASDLIGQAAPLVVMRPLAELGRHYPWRGPTEAFLGFEIEHDFMQRPPFVFPRWIYPLIRRHCIQTHAVCIEDYVLSRPPRGFSEFNVLAAYAWHHFRECFNFRDAAEAGLTPACCDWHWSWGGLTQEVRAAIAVHLAPEGAVG